MLALGPLKVQAQVMCGRCLNCGKEAQGKPMRVLSLIACKEDFSQRNLILNFHHIGL